MLRIVSFAAAALALTACVSQSSYDALRRANEVLQDQRDGLQARYELLESENKRLAGDVQRLGKSAAEASWLAEQKRKVQDLLAALERDNQGAELPEGVSIRQGALGTIVEVQGEVLFPSGQAKLTDAGRNTLSQLIRTLAADGRAMRIEGHTDSDPIRHSGWESNLHLSVARSLATATYLIGGGIPADRVSVGGYGEHRPRVEGDAADAKQQNRRVEILLLDRT